jgi:hypothetical protein
VIARGQRVAVLWPAIDDRLLVASTLPALAAALTARGVVGELIGPWDLRWDPLDLTCPRHVPWWRRAAAFVRRSITREPDPFASYRPSDGRLGHPFLWHEPPDRAEAVEARWWGGLDLGGFDVVVAPGLPAGRRALHHPSRRPGTPVLVADFHMLQGIDAWTPADRAHPDVRVTACFPSFAALYARHGLRDVAWRPYPVHLGHTRPSPSVAEGLVAAGRNGRAFDALAAAARSVGAGVVVLGDPALVAAAGAPLEPRGVVDLPTFVGTLRRADAVLVPLRHDPRHAAGITVVALALAAGKPVVASDTPAMRDHLRPGIDSLLVAEETPGAWADALRRVRDPSTRAHLAAGAAEAGNRLSVEAWADALVSPTAPTPR